MSRPETFEWSSRTKLRSDWFALPRRMPLKESTDLAWLPAALRDDLTYVMVRLHEIFKTSDLIEDLIVDQLKSQRIHTIIDLCSGAGGPTPALVGKLNSHHPEMKVRCVLTDLHPPESALERFNEANEQPDVSYDPGSISASEVPSSLQGLRLLCGAFHHLDNKTAGDVLRNAQDCRQPILIVEVIENNLLALVGSIFTFFVSWWVLTTRGWSVRRLLTCTLFPLVPLIYLWDAFASVLRTRTFVELDRLLPPRIHEYEWKILRVRAPVLWTPITVVLGQPSQQHAGS